jgi:hypothetical protein
MPLILLSTLHVFDSQNIFSMLLPIDTLRQTLYIRISQPITKRHVLDIQNMLALLIPTIMAQHTLCTSISEIQKYGFITLILLCIQHVFDSQNIFILFLPIVILHHALGYRTLCQPKVPCFSYPKHAGIGNPNHYGLVHIMQ